MSAAEDRKTKRFIPTLTEVIDNSEQMGLELMPSPPSSDQNARVAVPPLEKEVRHENDSHSAENKYANDFSLDESVLDLNIEEEEEFFSPLSRNPVATEDSLRPSDLMLIALTERIAAKARARVEENLEQHIQTKIFPLLDEFADQLVKHLEGDLLKMIREGLAEATREELSRLRKK